MLLLIILTCCWPGILHPFIYSCRGTLATRTGLTKILFRLNQLFYQLGYFWHGQNKRRRDQCKHATKKGIKRGSTIHIVYSLICWPEKRIYISLLFVYRCGKVCNDVIGSKSERYSHMWMGTLAVWEMVY